jgi:hypothetical protein
MDGDGCRDHRVEDAFGNLVAAAPQDRRAGHQVAGIAQEQQRAAVQHDLVTSVGCTVAAVGVEAAREGPAILGHLCRQRALHDAQPLLDTNRISRAGNCSACGPSA